MMYLMIMQRMILKLVSYIFWMPSKRPNKNLKQIFYHFVILDEETFHPWTLTIADISSKWHLANPYLKSDCSPTQKMGN